MPSGTSEDTLGRASTGVPGKRTSLQEQATPWDTITRTVNPSAYAYPGSNPGPATVVRAHFRVSSGRRRVKLCHTSRLTLRRARRTLVRPSKQSLAAEAVCRDFEGPFDAAATNSNDDTGHPAHCVCQRGLLRVHVCRHGESRGRVAKPGRDHRDRHALKIGAQFVQLAPAQTSRF